MANMIFDIYSDFSKLNIEKLKEAAGKSVWPKGKRYTVKLNGKEFKIQTYFSSAADKMAETDGILFDANAAIESMYVRELRQDEIRWETDGEPQYDDPKFNVDVLKRLEPEEIQKRNDFIIAVANLINNQETMEAIVAAATKKKNGTLYKNRLVRIAHCGIAGWYDRISAIVARAKTDLTMSITFEDVLCRPGDNKIWANDFVSTYHDGLIVSEAMKEAVSE